MRKNKYHIKIFISAFLLIVLMLNTISFASNMDVLITLDNILQLNETVNSLVTFENIAPGDEIDYTMHLKNETSESINLYLLEAMEKIDLQKLNKITFKIYIDNSLYVEANANNLMNEYIYTINPYDEVDVLIKVGLDLSAGNEYQNFNFNLSWKLGAKIKTDGDQNTNRNYVQNNMDAISDASTIEVSIIPKTGQNRNIYYVLYILIAFVLIYIAIILLKQNRKTNENLDNSNNLDKISDNKTNDLDK